MSGHGDGMRHLNQFVGYGWWLAALGALLVVEPQLAWVLLVVAAVFLGTRESGPRILSMERAS